jgi:DNA-binding transcriptional LysR family regulator
MHDKGEGMPWQSGQKARSLIHLQRVADPLRLRLLIEVGARGSISAAADACTMGQPSASLHLRHLEAAVGYRLIERGPSGSRLTPEGEVVRLHAAHVLVSLEAMLDELSAQQAGSRGTLAIAICTAVTRLLPLALRGFGERHPDVDVSVLVGSSAEVHAMVRSRDVAVGIAGPVPGANEVAREHFLDDEVVGIAAPGLIGPPRPFVSIEELAGCTLLVRQAGSGQQLAAARVLDELQAASELKTWLLDSEEAVKQAVREGIGIAFVSRLALRDEVRRGDVTTFRLRGTPPMIHPLHVARHADTTLTTAQSAFVAAMRVAGRTSGDEPSRARRRFAERAARVPRASAPAARC